MQAVVLEGIGGPEQLVLRELPPPDSRGRARSWSR